MKTLSATFVAIFMLAALSSCEANKKIKPEDLPADLSGVYIGKAKIFVKETQYWPKDSVVLINLRDEMVNDTITVTAIDVAAYQYKIEKTSDFYSYYDIAGEQFLDSTFQLNGGYEYDKNWETSIQFQPETNSLKASMLVQDIFGHDKYDSLGNPIYHYFQRKEYQITAIR